MATTTLVPVDLDLLAQQADEETAVGGGWATADPASVRAFQGWWGAYAIGEEAFEAAVEAAGVDRWQDLPGGVTSPCGGGSVVIHWWQLDGGDILGASTGRNYWQIPLGTPMPLIEGFTLDEDESDDEQ